MKEKSVRSNILLPAFLAVLLILPHLPFLNNDYIDTETIFVDSASRIAADGFRADLSDYYEVDANPILTSLIFAAGYRLFGESPVVSRLTIFVIAFAFVMFLYFYLKRRTGFSHAFLTALFVSVNPMFIVYSQYMAADVDFMMFSAMAFLLLIFPYSSKSAFASSIWFGVSLATKYAVIVLAPVVFLISLMKSRLLEHFSKAALFALLKFNVWYFATALLLGIPIILIVFQFQSRLLPSVSSGVGLSINLFIPRFFAYLIWLGLFLGPSSLVLALDLWQRLGKSRLFTLLVGLLAFTVVVHLFYPLSSLVVEKPPFGAMSLAGLESAMPPFYLSLALFFVLLAAELFITRAVIEIRDLWSAQDGSIRNVLFWGLIPIPLMSLNHATARYMLFVLVPVSLYMAHITARMYSERGTRSFTLAVLIAHALIFLGVGFYINYYFYQKGLAG